MPEPSILFTVTGVVIVGLAAWLAMVLKKSNEPWARTANADMVVAAKASDDPPVEPAAEEVAPTKDSDKKIEVAKSDPKVEAVAEEEKPAEEEKKSET